MGSHTSSGEWKSFEGRMRQRRAERLVLRASTAADSKLFDEARAAIGEARLLWPAAPGLADLELRLPERTPEPLERLTQPERSIQPERSPQPEYSTHPERSTQPATQPTLLILPERSTLQSNRSAQQPKRSPQRKELAVAAAITAFAATGVFTAAALLAPALINISGYEDLSDGQKRVEATDVILPAAVNARKVRQESPRANVETTPRTDLTPAPPVKSPSTPVPEQVIPATTPTFLPSAPLPAVWGAAQPPEEAPVRAVLARYAAAYSDLNVDAAASVWPGVNRSALAHAFHNLKSQSVALGNCQVRVEGDAARARCLGWATWRPRVGGGERTDARSWNFELERTDAGWQITNARAQNR